MVCRCVGRAGLVMAGVFLSALLVLPAAAQMTGPSSDHGHASGYDSNAGYDGSDGPGVLAPNAFAPVAPPTDQAKEIAALKRMEALGKWLDREVSQCTTKEVDCIADALEVYGRELRAIPVAESNVPAQASAVVLQASRQIRRSASREEAIKILDAAIRKVDQIRLVKSDDTVITEAIQGQKRTVEVALTTTRTALARAVEL